MKNRLFTAIITVAVMMLIYLLTNMLSTSWPKAELTIRYIGYFSAFLLGAVIFFQEVSIWEITTDRLIVYPFDALSPGTSWSIIMLKVTWGAVSIFFTLFVLSLFNFFSTWVEELLGGPIILWLAMLFSFLVMFILAVRGHDFWCRMANKTKKY